MSAPTELSVLGGGSEGHERKYPLVSQKGPRGTDYHRRAGAGGCVGGGRAGQKGAVGRVLEGPGSWLQ